MMDDKGKQTVPVKQAAPVKQTMNLCFKEDRTTKPATFMLYALFAVVVLLGLLKLLVYDLWMKVNDARDALAVVQSTLAEAMSQLENYDEVKENYQRYSATDEELALLDRLEVVALLDKEVGAVARMHSYSVAGMEVQIAIDEVSLAQTADIVRRLEASPIVKHITVNTASTTSGEEGGVGEAIGSLVSASIHIELTKEVKEDEKTIVIP